MPTMLLRFIAVDNHRYSQKPSAEKSAIGNEPYTKGVALLDDSFVGPFKIHYTLDCCQMTTTVFVACSYVCGNEG